MLLKFFALLLSFNFLQILTIESNKIGLTAHDELICKALINDAYLRLNEINESLEKNNDIDFNLLKAFAKAFISAYKSAQRFNYFKSFLHDIANISFEKIKDVKDFNAGYQFNNNIDYIQFISEL